MPKTSAGILPYRRIANQLEVLLVHPGGPFWARKDLAAWSIAKGEYGDDEKPFDAALREFEEETGCQPSGPFIQLTSRKMPSGKIVDAWATVLDWDPSSLVSNTFSMEWPRGSGGMQEFPEVDRAEWFTIDDALRKIQPGQKGFVEELNDLLAA